MNDLSNFEQLLPEYPGDRHGFPRPLDAAIGGQKKPVPRVNAEYRRTLRVT